MSLGGELLAIAILSPGFDRMARHRKNGIFVNRGKLGTSGSQSVVSAWAGGVKLKIPRRILLVDVLTCQKFLNVSRES